MVFRPCSPNTLCGISSRFQLLFPIRRQVAHALLTRPPLIGEPKLPSPFDLNVLCTPPAFILSQDQTLEKSLSKKNSSESFHSLFTLVFELYNLCTHFFFELTRFFTNFFLSFVSLHRCSIFKDRSFAASQSLAHSLYIISHYPAFVKTFLQSFSGFFADSFVRSLASLCSLVRPSRMRPCYSITSPPFCQVLFQNFS